MMRIDRSNAIPIDERDFEFVERKGRGHPDTLIDGAVEEISRSLCREYLDAFGSIRHHNVDKALITGGSTSVSFGGGRFDKPIFITLSGRATGSVGKRNVPVAQIAVDATRRHIRKSTRFLADGDYAVDSKISQGAASLTSLIKGMPRANDTSVSVGFAPMSRLERTVLETERQLNSPSFKARCPEVGEDIKIMGARSGDGIELTVAAAFVSRYVSSLSDYRDKKERLEENARKMASRLAGDDVSVSVNSADKGKDIYLTLTGLSCEMGDDGSVGRGNRVNGLITPTRLMSLEATAGKNPVNHVGKIYSVLAFRIAQDVVGLGAEGCDAYLQSRIGDRIDKPSFSAADIIWDKEKIKRDAPRIRRIFDEHLDAIPELTMEFVKGKVKVF
ncbi:S-adenosylmethionine synthase [uncultured archaeon]|nr:S-adenosylmethionine synthase [uncultured archaeon]